MTVSLKGKTGKTLGISSIIEPSITSLIFDFSFWFKFRTPIPYFFNILCKYSKIVPGYQGRARVITIAIGSKLFNKEKSV